MSLPLWFGDLLFWSVQAAVLTLAAAFLVKILRIGEPRALLVCWRTLVGASLLLPFVEPWRQEAPVMLSAAPDFSISTAVSAARTAAPHWRFPSAAVIAEILGAAVAVGIAARLVMLALGLMKLRQLRRKSVAISARAGCAGTLEQARELTRGCAEFRLSGEVDSPVTFGFAKPVILLPEKFVRLDARFQTAIACHELLHVRRRDWAHHLGEELVRAIFWFHPAILWLVGRVRLAREQVVDLEVVGLTVGRETYVQALLEFTTGHKVAIPAPPFLAERQLVERVALMFKEAGMSRRRLIASLSVVGCGVVAVAVLAVTVFPLKAVPRASARAQGARATSLGSGLGVIDAKAIWTDTVKQGTMDWNVRGLGTMAVLNGRPVAKIELAESQAGNVRAGQVAEVDTHKGIIEGRVADVSPEVIRGTRSAVIVLGSAVPNGVGAHAAIEGTIQIAKLENVVYVGRPVNGEENSQRTIFKIIDNGKEAEQVRVEYGRASVSKIQVLSGLKPGDTVILAYKTPDDPQGFTGMFAYEQFNRLEIKNPN